MEGDFNGNPITDLIEIVDAVIHESKGTHFGVTESASPKLKEFEADHINCGRNAAIGGAWTYSFTPTSIGVITEIACCCGGKLDFTDYETW